MSGIKRPEKGTLRTVNLSRREVDYTQEEVQRAIGKVWEAVVLFNEKGLPTRGLEVAHSVLASLMWGVVEWIDEKE